MAKVKLTKTELKAQSDALKRFQRFLPMLQLKKQQLQSEIAGIIAKAEAVSAKERAVREGLNKWVGLFATDEDLLPGLVSVKNIKNAKKAIKKAFQNQLDGKGFSLIEVLSTCPTNWGMTPAAALKWVDEKMIPYYPLGVYKDKDAAKEETK